MKRVFSQENLQALADTISPALAAGERTIVHILPLSGRFGHLALEPHAFSNLHRDTHDRLVVVSRSDRSAAYSRGVRDLVAEHVDFFETDNEALLEMGHHDGDNQDLGLFSLVIASAPMLFARFIEMMAEAGPSINFKTPYFLRARAEPYFRSWGVGDRDKLVALHVRDQGTHPRMTEQAYRNADLETYEPLLRFLLAEGFLSGAEIDHLRTCYMETIAQLRASQALENVQSGSDSDDDFQVYQIRTAHLQHPSSEC